MSDDGIDDLKNALALQTSLLHARESGARWDEPHELAQDLAAGPRAHAVMIGLAHITTVVLRFAAELAAGAEAEGVDIAGVPGGVTPSTLLQEIGRQILEEESRES